MIETKTPYRTWSQGSTNLMVVGEVAHVSFLRTNSEARFKISEVLEQYGLKCAGKYTVAEQHWYYSSKSTEVVKLYKNVFQKWWMSLTWQPLVKEVTRRAIRCVQGPQCDLPIEGANPGLKFEYAYTKIMIPVKSV